MPAPEALLSNTDGLTPSNVALYNFKIGTYYGTFNVANPQDLADPALHFGARPLDDEHVKFLMSSFQQNPNINKKVMVVVISTALYKLYQKDMAIASANHYKLGGSSSAQFVPPASLTYEALAQNKAVTPLYCVAGNHTRHALHRLKEMYPQQRLFNLTDVAFHVAPDVPNTWFDTHSN